MREYILHAYDNSTEAQIIRAARKNDSKKVLEIIKENKNPYDFTFKITVNYSPQEHSILSWAVYNNYENIINELLTNNHNLNVNYNYYNGPIITLAIYNKDDDLFRKIINHPNFNPNKTCNNYTPLMQICTFKYLNGLKMFLKKFSNIDINLEIKNQTAFSRIFDCNLRTQRNKESFAITFLQFAGNKLNINITNEINNPLALAIRYNYTDLVHEILDQYDNLDINFRLENYCRKISYGYVTHSLHYGSNKQILLKLLSHPEIYLNTNNQYTTQLSTHFKSYTEQVNILTARAITELYFLYCSKLSILRHWHIASHIAAFLFGDFINLESGYTPKKILKTLISKNNITSDVNWYINADLLKPKLKKLLHFDKLLKKYTRERETKQGYGPLAIALRK